MLYYAERTSYGCGVCPSVCPSHAINASKLITAGSSVCGHRIATGLQLLTLNRLQQIQNSFAVVKTARSTHGIPVLEVIVEHIEHKLPSVTYRVLTTTYYYHATYLSSQRDIYSTHSQYPILICCHLARPPTVSSSKTTDRSLTYASPRFWNQLYIFISSPSPVSSWFTSSWCQVVFVIITTFSIHYSLILSLQVQKLPFPKFFPP